MSNQTLNIALPPLAQVPAAAADFDVVALTCGDIQILAGRRFHLSSSTKALRTDQAIQRYGDDQPISLVREVGKCLFDSRSLKCRNPLQLDHSSGNALNEAPDERLLLTGTGGRVSTSTSLRASITGPCV
jgi:hypothetical protein